MWWWWRVVVGAAAVVCLINGHLSLTHAAKFTECELDAAGVYVSISADDTTKNDTTARRLLEVTWYGMGDDLEGDSWVGLWTKDPAVSLHSPLLAQSPAFCSEGVMRTGERWDGSLIPSSVEGTGDTCLPYWAGYVREGVLLYSACLMLRPHWMSGLKSELLDSRLTKVALPGTHDAGSSGHFGLPVIGDLVGRWTFTQDESLWQQLVLGARYMDMRIAYYPHTEERFFVNHGEMRIAPLQLYIDDVVNFMSQTEEIIIFDIHQLQVGFDGHPERHEELITLLESSFGEWMAPADLAPDPTVGELWGSGSTLIVTYPSPEGSYSSYLWHNVHHLWGDVNELGDLEEFLYTGIPQQTERGSLWSAMAEFTPSALDVASDRWGGLRGAATLTNPQVTLWFRQDWWDQVNIVAMDYLPSSDVVSVAVAANQMRHQCLAKRKKSHMSKRAKRWWASDGETVASLTATAAEPSGPRVWLWVSALASTSPEGAITQRRLDINWDVPEVQEGDWVGLFDHDPSEDWSAPVRQVTPVASLDHHTTDMALPHLRVHANMTEASCLGWWVAYVRHDSPIATDCVKVRPKWMSMFKDQLSGVSLRDLVIPGVHDAGTYSPYSAIADTALYKYAITQDESIYNQLVYGNRYIDLRVGYFAAETEEPYWVVHGLTVWHPLRDVLQQLRSFVLDTGEVVLVDVGGFTHFGTGGHHDGCIALITQVFGDLMAPRSHGWEAPLGDLLQTSTSLIVIYNNQQANGHPLFWPYLPGRWANAQTLAGLEEYMTRMFEVEGPPTPPWTLGGQLTPLALDVVTDDLGGLRTMADEVNRNVTHWMRDRWWQQISIISCDFVLSAGYVDVAIELNLRRLNQHALV